MSDGLQCVAAGLQFPEGPAFDGQGRCHVVECNGGWVTRIGPGGRVQRLVNTGGTPNGLAFDSSGALWIAEAGLGKLLKYAGEELCEVVGEYAAEPLRRPNDLCFAPSGAIYMTGPGGSNADTAVGVIYRIDPEGSIEVVAHGLRFPNGLALSPDASVMYVAETCAHRLLVFAVRADGSLSEPEEFAPTPGGVGGDGICLDVEGNIYVAHYGAGQIPVFSPHGELLDKLPAGGMNPTNVAFGGDAMRELWITEVETSAVYRLTLQVAGLKLFSDPR